MKLEVEKATSADGVVLYFALVRTAGVHVRVIGDYAIRRGIEILQAGCNKNNDVFI